MFVLQLASSALFTFFASTLWAASVGLYAGTFDPPTRSEERIIRCALGDTALSRECQSIGKEISRVVVLVNEDSGQDTLASTRERVRRVDIEMPPLGMLCILSFLPLSIREVPHYSAIGETSMPLTEPDLQISHIRLFSYPHFTGDKV